MLNKCSARKKFEIDADYNLLEENIIFFFSKTHKLSTFFFTSSCQLRNCNLFRVIIFNEYCSLLSPIIFFLNLLYYSCVHKYKFYNIYLSINIHININPVISNILFSVDDLFIYEYKIKFSI